MMRSFFLYLAGSVFWRRLLMALPFATTIAKRFVAGETLEEAIHAAKQLNAKGLLVTVDNLGESVHNVAEAERATRAYLDLLDAMAAAQINGNASLKLTQLGLDINEDLCITNMRHILSRAVYHKTFIRIDMESTAYTERTLRIYRTLREEYNFTNVGVVIQSYLRRSEQDVRELATEGGNIRLCKGAYKEPPALAFPEKADVDANYIKLMQIFLDDAARAKGAYIGCATHDPAMIEATKGYAAAQAIPKDRFEFQMLYGIRAQLQTQLASEQYKMRIYIPYGTEWYPYFMRRLAERPANVWFLLKNLVRG